MTNMSSRQDIDAGNRGHLSHADVESSYARWAPVYDRVFNRMMRRGRTAAAEAVNRHGGRTLNIGVGTGLELPMFTPNVRITGVDLSAPMLDIARKRVAKEHLTNVDELLVMDALALEFEDASFDVAVAPYVITTVPDPVRALEEMARVVRPGGELVIVNHISAEKGPIAWTEVLFARFAGRLGWRPLFPWSIIGDWIDSRSDLELLERRVQPPLGMFNLIRIARK